MAKRFSAGQCEKLLDGRISYRAEELSNLCDLRRDQDPAYRLIAVRRVLTHPGVDPNEALAIARIMKGDDDGNVRDAVHQFLDKGAGKVRDIVSAAEQSDRIRERPTGSGYIQDVRPR